MSMRSAGLSVQRLLAGHTIVFLIRNDDIFLGRSNMAEVQASSAQKAQHFRLSDTIFPLCFDWELTYFTCYCFKLHTVNDDICHLL